MKRKINPIIAQRQDAIIGAFKIFGEDREAKLEYLMDVGSQLPPLDLIYRTEAYLIKGCMSKVWLAELEVYKRLFFQADSNAAITKGLISLLVSILSGQQMKDILDADLYFVEAIGLEELIGFQRASGLAHMIKEIKLKAFRRLEELPSIYLLEPNDFLI